jgi:hypothetical protein
MTPIVVDQNRNEKSASGDTVRNSRMGCARLRPFGWIAVQQRSTSAPWAPRRGACALARVVTRTDLFGRTQARIKSTQIRIALLPDAPRTFRPAQPETNRPAKIHYRTKQEQKSRGFYIEGSQGQNAWNHKCFRLSGDLPFFQRTEVPGGLASIPIRDRESHSSLLRKHSFPAL